MNLVQGPSCGQSAVLAKHPCVPRMSAASAECSGQPWRQGPQSFGGGGIRLLGSDPDLRSLWGRRVPSKSRALRRNRAVLHCRAAQVPELLQIAPTTAVVYGASLLGGGLFAYLRTGSRRSLAGGVTGGAALGVAFALMQFPGTRDLGNAIGFGAALLFASFFGIRLAATRKLVPSGILLGGSTLATIIFAEAYLLSRL